MASLSNNSKKILKVMAEIAKEKTLDFGWLMNETLDILCNPYGKAARGTAPKRIYMTVSSLKRGGYLEQTERKGRKEIKITDKTKLVLLEEEIRKKYRKTRWDKKWRFVIFDVPEDDRRERNFLRSFLKSFGLKELQKSVWVFPYDIEKEFHEFLRLCNKKLEGDIRFVTVEKISYDADLKRHFKLA